VLGEAKTTSKNLERWTRALPSEELLCTAEAEPRLRKTASLSTNYRQEGKVGCKSRTCTSTAKTVVENSVLLPFDFSLLTVIEASPQEKGSRLYHHEH